MSSSNQEDSKIDLSQIMLEIARLNKEVTILRNNHKSLVDYINRPFDKLPPSYSPPKSIVK